MYNPKLHFHFTGIGGSGMSGIAEVLLDLGFKVSGSDLTLSPVCERLVRMGAEIHLGHSAEHLPAESSLLVYSSAVPLSNSELLEAKRRGIPVVRRAEVLAELMRLKFGVAVAGSHGKTSTTSMIGAILEEGKLEPTIVIGGQVKSLGSGGKLGKGSYLVAESDESDRSFLLLRPTVAVVTNIDKEHMEAYESFEDLKDAFRTFVNSVPFYGLAIFCLDDAHVCEMALSYTRRKVTYGFHPEADVRAEDLRLSPKASWARLVVHGEDLGEFELPMIGRHFMQNALAAVAVGLEFGIDVEVIRAALKKFSGVSRRLEIVYEADGITIVSDYGHHPTEIRAAIAALRTAWEQNLGRLIVVFEPHRYSRVRDCFEEFAECFSECDKLFIAPLYPASETPIAGVHSEALLERISHPDAELVSDLMSFPERLADMAKEGDLILCLGAGSVGRFTELLTSVFHARR